MHFLQAINSDISVLIVCNKTGGTIKGDIKKNSRNPICTIHYEDHTTRLAFALDTRKIEVES